MSANVATIEPFWRRLRQIWLYPLQLGPLLTIVVLAVVQTFVSYLMIVGWILSLLALGAVYRYAFLVLRATANGRMEPPEGLGDVDNGLGMTQIGLIAMYIFIGIVGGAVLVAMQLPLLAIAWVVLLAVAYPGSTMSLAIEMNFWHALNPATPLSIMGRLGWPYFVVALLCLLFVFCQANAESLLTPYLPLPLDQIVSNALGNYVTIASFHLMGYLIYQYHDELGYEIDAPLTLRKAADDPDQDLLDDCEALTREGRLDEATNRIAAHLRERGGSSALHQRYRKILAAQQDQPALLAHGRQWLSVLVAQEKLREGLNLARECLALDPAFRPQHPEEVLPLASAAQQQNQSQLALQLLSGFHQQHPKHRDVPAVLFLASQVLAERFNQEDKARQLLAQLKSRYPEHALMPEIERYQQFLDKLAAAPAGRAAG